MTLEISKNINWSDNLEKYFKDIGEKSYCYSYLNKKAEQHYSYYRNFIDLPVIILSTIAGTLSIGGGSFWGEENEQQGSIAVGIISLCVGIMNTVGTYFAFSKRAEAHRISAIQYSKLYRFLQIELSLPQQERMTPADLLKVSRDNYERLQEISPLIPYNILEHFKEKFKQYKVSKPSEANGLEEIIIYREDGEEIDEEEEEIEEQQIRESG